MNRCSYKGEAYTTDRYKHLSVKIRSKSSKYYWKRTVGSPKPLGEPTPPIVSEELWQDANKIVTGKKFKRASRPFEHWLRGRVLCMNCDVKMGLVWLANKWKVKCPQCHLLARLEDVEGVTWKAILTGCDNPEILRNSLLSKAEDTTQRQTETTLESLTARERDLRSKVSNLVDMAEDAKSTAARDAYETRINERTAEIEEVQRLAQTLKASLQEIKARQKEADSIVNKVEKERHLIEDVDMTIKVKLADLVGAWGMVGRREDSLDKLVGGLCVPQGLTLSSIEEIRADADCIQVFQVIEGGKGRYRRSK